MSFKTNVAEELSKTSGVTIEQAEKILGIFRFDKLIERVDAIEQTMKDPKAQMAMGMIKEDFEAVRDGKLREGLRIQDLRLVPSHHAILDRSVLHLIDSPK